MLQGCCRVGWTWQALVWLQKKDMNLSSCVTDSLLLSLDSAGQTLGTGTNPPPLSSLQPFVAKPDELGTLGEGERATELWERLQGFTMEREQKDPAGNTFPVVFQVDTGGCGDTVRGK